MEIKGYNKIYNHINSHIKDLHKHDCGAFNIWESSSGETLVDIEWADGVSAFNLFKVMNLIRNKGMVTKAELVEECL